MEQRREYLAGGQASDSHADAIGDFGAVMPAHLPAMLRAAAALVGVADAEDAAQEAILRAWQAWDTLRNPGHARAWLLRITIHVCLDWQRGRFGTRRALTLPLFDDAPLPLAMLGADPGASDHTGALDLRQAINALDADLRAAIVLRYYAQMDATEIGAALGVPPATVRGRVRRALIALRARLSGPPARPTPVPAPELRKEAADVRLDGQL
ncbi:MAG TPA: sigma-70 family RNA polymerase sigma factor [Ktedonobacterales bacterium]|nr:sigma-70 family RNA polymerase sigma factor [Ktedonobacterales bacterium]